MVTKELKKVKLALILLGLPLVFFVLGAFYHESPVFSSFAKKYADFYMSVRLILSTSFLIGYVTFYWSYSKAKGRSGGLGLFLMWFSLIGLLILLSLKDKSGNKNVYIAYCLNAQ